MTTLAKIVPALAVLTLSSTAFAATAPADSPPPAPAPIEGTVWDLKPLYPDDAAWETERKAIEAALPTLAALKGTLHDGTSLQSALDQISAMEKRLQRLQLYAHLTADEDLRVQPNQARRQLADDLDSKLGEATSFLRPEVVALGHDQVEAFVAATPGLAKHKYNLETLLRQAPHTLGPEGESILAAAETPLAQPEAIYHQLADADIPWPTIDIRGKKVTLDQEGYVNHRDDADPEVRKRVFDTFWKTFKSYERSIGAVYNAEVRDKVFRAKARHYTSALAASLADHNVPESVYHTLISETHAGLPTLHRYLSDGQKILGLPKMRYSDIYVPLAKSSRTYTLAEAKSLILDGVKPLGPDYIKDLNTAFSGSWLNSVVQRGKYSGAYEDDAYGVHPYVLMSFAGNYESVTTLAHEFGHALHSVLSDRAQPFETSEYPIFIAEIPSQTNEMLLADHVYATAKTKAEKIYALSEELELLRGGFYRQAMFAEFEAKTHDAVEHGEALTGDSLTKIYRDLLKQYMGDAEGVVSVDDLYGVEWAYIPHFYLNFYVYQYATSISAAAYFATGVENGDTGLRDRYFTMLKAGGSDDPYIVVKNAGVDMASPEPYRALVARMGHLLDLLEAEMAKKG